MGGLGAWVPPFPPFSKYVNGGLISPTRSWPRPAWVATSTTRPGPNSFWVWNLSAPVLGTRFHCRMGGGGDDALALAHTVGSAAHPSTPRLGLFPGRLIWMFHTRTKTCKQWVDDRRPRCVPAGRAGHADRGGPASPVSGSESVGPGPPISAARSR